MSFFKQLQYLTWTIILFAAAAFVSCQELTSTLREGNRACPGDEVIFTCTVRGPSSLQVLTLAWSSTEYIFGQGGSLQLSTANMLGHVEKSTMDGTITAIATVTNITNGEPVLESTLRITATVASTVTCMSGADGGTASIRFSISAVPGVPQRISAAEISRPHDNICIILVTWDLPANSDAADIGQYMVYVPSRNIRDVSPSTISFLTVTVPNCGDDTRVQVAAVNRVGCVGMNSSEVQLTPLDTPTTAATDSEDGSPTASGGSTFTSSELVFGAVIAAITVFGIGVAVVVIFFIVCWCRHCLLRNQVDFQDSSSTDSSTGDSEDKEVADIPKKTKECYQKQSKHDFDELGTEEDQVSIPIWIDGALDADWKDSLDKAVQAINEAAPGLLLSITVTESDKSRASVHVLATDEKKTYTEGDIRMRFTPGQTDHITKIHLGNLRKEAKKGFSTRELFRALGFHEDNHSGLTTSDPLSVLLYQGTIHISALKKYLSRFLSLNKYSTRENAKLSELDKVSLNLVYRPCKGVIANTTRYEPKLGKTGMYYCGRHVMSGNDDNDTNGKCGPDNGPNCPACRTIKSPKVEEILAKGKWQGMSGRVYCGRSLANTGGICGIDNGPACSDCRNLLNN